MSAGRRIETPFVRMHIAAATTSHRPEIACIVGKRVHRHATIRHRYQRLMRVAARTVIARFNSPHDMVWVAKPEITTVKKLPELEQSLKPYLDDIFPA